MLPSHEVYMGQATRARQGNNEDQPKENFVVLLVFLCGLDTSSTVILAIVDPRHDRRNHLASNLRRSLWSWRGTGRQTSFMSLNNPNSF